MTVSLVATSHGTDVPAAREAITALVDAVREAAPRLDVREAYVDVQEPRVGRVVDGIVGRSVVVPLLLAPGFHVNVDIHRATRGAESLAAGTLGPDRRLTDVLLRRLVECGATTDDIVVLAAAGSTDTRAHRSVAATARLLGAAWGSPVPVGYLGGSGTPVGDVLDRVSGTGRRVVVASYLMAPGFFYNRLLAGPADAVTRPLLDGPTVDPLMVEIVLDRFAAAADALETAAARL